MLEAGMSQTSPDGKLEYILDNTEGISVINTDTKTVQSKWWITSVAYTEKGTEHNVKGIVLYKGALYGFEPGYGVHVWELDEAGNICDEYGWCDDEDESDYEQLKIRPETEQLYLQVNSNTQIVFNLMHKREDRLRWCRKQTC